MSCNSERAIANPPHPWRKFIRWLLIGGLVALFIWIGAEVIQVRAKDAVRNRRNCMRSLIGFLHAFNVHHGDATVDQQSLMSWRAMACWMNTPRPQRPDTERAWNVTPNTIVTDWVPWPFCTPGNPHTRIIAVRGEDTLFDAGIGKLLEEVSAAPDTILLIELHQDLLIWTQPGDLMVNGSAGLSGFKALPESVLTQQGDDYFIGFADESAWLISRNTPIEAISPFLTLSGAATHDRDRILGPYVVAKWPGDYGIRQGSESAHTPEDDGA